MTWSQSARLDWNCLYTSTIESSVSIYLYSSIMHLSCTTMQYFLWRDRGWSTSWRVTALHACSPAIFLIFGLLKRVIRFHHGPKNRSQKRWWSKPNQWADRHSLDLALSPNRQAPGNSLLQPHGPAENLTTTGVSFFRVWLKRARSTPSAICICYVMMYKLSAAGYASACWCWGAPASVATAPTPTTTITPGVTTMSYVDQYLVSFTQRWRGRFGTSSLRNWTTFSDWILSMGKGHSKTQVIDPAWNCASAHVCNPV